MMWVAWEDKNDKIIIILGGSQKSQGSQRLFQTERTIIVDK